MKRPIYSLHLGYFVMLLLASPDFCIQNKLFLNFLPGTLIRMSNCLDPVGYQQATNVAASMESINVKRVEMLNYV